MFQTNTHSAVAHLTHRGRPTRPLPAILAQKKCSDLFGLVETTSGVVSELSANWSLQTQLQFPPDPETTPEVVYFFRPGPGTTRPGVSPVWLPSLSTGTPLTITCIMPVEY